MNAETEKTIILCLGLAISSFFTYAGFINPRVWVRTGGSKDQRRRVQDFQLADDEKFVASCRLAGFGGSIGVVFFLYGLYANLQSIWR